MREVSCTQCNGHGVLCTGDREVSTTVKKSTAQVDSTAFNLIISWSEYCTHAMKTKRRNYNVQEQRRGLRLIAKEAKLKEKQKLNTIG